MLEIAGGILLAVAVLAFLPQILTGALYALEGELGAVIGAVALAGLLYGLTYGLVAIEGTTAYFVICTILALGFLVGLIWLMIGGIATHGKPDAIDPDLPRFRGQLLYRFGARVRWLVIEAILWAASVGTLYATRTPRRHFALQHSIAVRSHCFAVCLADNK